MSELISFGVFAIRQQKEQHDWI